MIAEVKFIGSGAILKTDRPFNLEDGVYNVTLKEKKEDRTLRQNRYLWALIGEICKKENGDLRNEEEVYCTLLQMAGAKYETIIIPEEAVERFRGLYRDIKVIGRQVVNHRSFAVLHVFYGSSKMNTKEMNELLDTAIRYANELGIDTGGYYD